MRSVGPTDWLTA
jgi:hypothetical protein